MYKGIKISIIAVNFLAIIICLICSMSLLSTKITTQIDENSVFDGLDYSWHVIPNSSRICDSLKCFISNDLFGLSNVTRIVYTRMEPIINPYTVWLIYGNSAIMMESIFVILWIIFILQIISTIILLCEK